MLPEISKCTSILVVDEVEPCVDFWVHRLGLELTASVPHGDRIGFAILTRGAVEIMYQSLESTKADTGFSELTKSVLFLEVDDIDRAIAALEGVEVVVEKRETFYGATEYFVREPGGNVVGFAQFKREA